MLLVGSRAARFHFPGFRQPADWDVFAAEDEAARLGERLRDATPPTPHKRRFHFRGTILEVEIARPGTTTEALLARSKGKLVVPDLGTLAVAAPDALLVLKRSHVPFLIHWRKTMRDIRFLRRKVRALAPEMEELLARRIAETSRRLLPTQRSYPMADDVLCVPAGTHLMHARLHRCVARAVPSLGAKDAVARIREEVLVVALERFWLVPGAVEARNERAVLVDAYELMVTKLIALNLRETAADVFDQVLMSIPPGALDAAAAHVDETRPALFREEAEPADYLALLNGP
jgi:hypothetical protein